MKTNILMIILMGLLSHNSIAATQEPAPSVQGVNVTISWMSPSEYRDVDKNVPKRQKEQLELIAHLGKQIVKASSKILGEGMSLELHVTGIDLAGQLEPAQAGIHNYVRVVRQGFPAVLAFEYTLKDKNGKVINKGVEKLTQYSSQINTSKGENRYVMHVFKRWLKKVK